MTKSLALFALPLLGTSVIQQLYSTVDLLFVGNVLGTEATAALGIGALLLTLLIGLFTGVSMGINVRVANLVGEGNRAGVAAGIDSASMLSLLAGVLLVALGEASASWFVDVMEVPGESAPAALAYLRFGVAAALPIAAYNAAAGALRGLGDSQSPFVAQTIGGLCNIGANWLALCVFELGIVGCAVATFVSNGIAATLAYAFLARARRSWHSDGFTPGQHIPKLDRSFVRGVLTFGVPFSVQTVAITLSNVAVQHQIDLLGVHAMAAFTVYLKVELPIYFAILAIGQAVTTFVAQNHGAGNDERCRQVVRTGQVMCLVATVVLSVVMLAIGYWAFWVFDHDAQVIDLGLAIIHITFPFYFLYAVLEVQGDALRGLGQSLAPAIVVLANICVLRVILVFALTAHGGSVEAVAVTYPITWFTCAVCMTLLRVSEGRFV